MKKFNQFIAENDVIKFEPPGGGTSTLLHIRNWYNSQDPNNLVVPIVPKQWHVEAHWADKAQGRVEPDAFSAYQTNSPIHHARIVADLQEKIKQHGGEISHDWYEGPGGANKNSYHETMIRYRDRTGAVSTAGVRSYDHFNNGASWRHEVHISSRGG